MEVLATIVGIGGTTITIFWMVLGIRGVQHQSSSTQAEVSRRARRTLVPLTALSMVVTVASFVAIAPRLGVRDGGVAEIFLFMGTWTLASIPAMVVATRFARQHQRAAPSSNSA